MPRDCVHGQLARKCEICDLIASENELVKLQRAVLRWVRADRAWTLCQGRDPAVQDEMDQATYALHNLADALEGE